jgi:hypothetical protein
MGLVNLLEGSEDNLSEDNQKLVEYIKLSAEELDAIIRDISKKSEGIYNES